MKIVPQWRQIRERRGWSLSEAAERIGITKGGLSHIETGRFGWSMRTLMKAAAVYGCQPGELYTTVEEDVCQKP